MADYRELLKRSVNTLPENTAAARRALYERARSALIEQLRAIHPQLTAPDITAHRLQLEDSIRAVEQEVIETQIGRFDSSWIDRETEQTAEVETRIAPPPSAPLPPQRRDVTVFRVGPTGIDIEEDQVLEVLSDSRDQRLAYEALRQEVGNLLTQGTNLLGDAEGALLAIAAALPQQMADARVFALWRAGNKLRRLYRAHLAVSGLDGGHPTTLDPAIAEFVGAICDEFNNLAAIDPGLRQRDAWRTQPESAIDVTAEFQSTNFIIDQVIEADLVGPLTAAEIATDRLEQPDSIQVAIPEIDLVNRVRRNFISALIHGAFDAARQIVGRGAGEVSHAARAIADGFYANIGTGAGFVMIAILITNGGAFRAYAANVLASPEAVAAIDWILKVFTTATF